MALQTDLRVVETLLPGESEAPLRDHPRCLCRFEDGVVFAYADHGRNFIRASDRELWAVEREDVLVSARSGSPLANRRGRVFFAAETGEPLYYERAI